MSRDQRPSEARNAVPCTCTNPALHDRECPYLLACAPYGRCARCTKALTLPYSMPGSGPDICGDCWRTSQRTNDACPRLHEHPSLHADQSCVCGWAPVQRTDSASLCLGDRVRVRPAPSIADEDVGKEGIVCQLGKGQVMIAVTEHAWYASSSLEFLEHRPEPPRNVALADAIVRNNAETADLIAFVTNLAEHPDIGDSLTAADREKDIQRRAREVLAGVPQRRESPLPKGDPSMWNAITTAFLAAVHNERPCPFCECRTDNVWPYCVHFSGCILHDWMDKLRDQLDAQNPLLQCPVTYDAPGDGPRVELFCQKRAGHEGAHEDSDGYWPSESSSKEPK